MDNKLAEKFVDSSLGHAEQVGKTPGLEEAEFYEALESVYSRANDLGIEPNYFRGRALAIEKAFIRRQMRYLGRKVDECLTRQDITGFRAYNTLRGRQIAFLQTLKSTEKTAVELGKQEIVRRMTLAIGVDTLLSDDAAIYMMLVSIGGSL